MMPQPKPATSGPAIDPEEMFIDKRAITDNTQTLSFIRSFTALLMAVMVGLFNASPLVGFSIYILNFFATSLLIYVKCGDISKYFPDHQSPFFDGVFGEMLVYIIFWVFSQNLVYIL